MSFDGHSGYFHGPTIVVTWSYLFHGDLSPSTEVWIKMWSIYKMEYIVPFAEMRMNLEIVIQVKWGWLCFVDQLESIPGRSTEPIYTYMTHIWSLF